MLDASFVFYPPPIFGANPVFWKVSTVFPTKSREMYLYPSTAGLSGSPKLIDELRDSESLRPWRGTIPSWKATCARGPSRSSASLTSRSLARSNLISHSPSSGTSLSLSALSCSVAPVFPLFFGGCPTKMVFPKKGSLFFPGSVNN